MGIDDIAKLGEVLQKLGPTGIAIIEGVIIGWLYRDARASDKLHAEALEKKNAEHAHDLKERNAEFMVKVLDLTKTCADVMKDSSATAQALKEQLRDIRGKRGP